MNAKNQSNFVAENQSTLYIMCGIPGSGKSSWAKEFKKKIDAAGYYCKIVSRDEIRFKLLDERGGDYFDHEKEVGRMYYEEIQKYLDRGYQVIADATQITKKSREKLLDHLDIDKNLHIYCVDLDTPIAICKRLNEQREGRQRVPDSVIDRMHSQKETPCQHEYLGFSYDGVITISFSEIFFERSQKE